MFNFGIDLGGTNISAGIVDKNHNIISKSSIKTGYKKTTEELCDDMSNLYHFILNKANINEHQIDFVGIGIPGKINKITNVVEKCPNLFINNWNVIDMMKNKINKPIMIENDAVSALIGEKFFIPNKNNSPIVMITIGTGIGSAVMINNDLIQNSEIGHMIINKNGRICNCGQRGCFETYASITGLKKTTKEFLFKNKNSLINKLINDDFNNISGKTTFIAKNLGDATAIDIVNEYISDLSCGILNIINIFNPETILIGGGISIEKDNLILPIKHVIGSTKTKIIASTLLNNAGIIGAAALSHFRTEHR